MIEALSFDFRSHLCCDCIAVQKVHPHVVAVGSYELLPGASPPENDASVSVGVGGQMRAGAIDFFAIGRESLHHVHHLSCAAVFDAEWSQSSDSRLAASTADGSIILASGNESFSDVRLDEFTVERDCMASGVSWHSDSLSLCCSLTSGSVAVVDIQFPDAPVFLTLGAHDAEAWCCSWLDDDVFVTGSDDCQFKIWDRRSPETAICSVRSHDAGVTFLGRAPGTDASCNVFVSGSYDGTIKLWDMRAIGSGPSKGGRGCLAKLEIEGGGVWAIDWMKLKDGNWIGAVAGMYSGVHVVGLSSTNGAVGGSRLQLLDSNQKIHGDGALVIKFDAANLSSKVSDFDQVYGCSWLPNSGDSAPCLLSCSFYNKMIGMSHWT